MREDPTETGDIGLFLAIMLIIAVLVLNVDSCVQRDQIRDLRQRIEWLERR